VADTPTEPVIPPANGVQCLDCGFAAYYKGETECPEEPIEHSVQPVYISEVALGFPDDADYKLPRKQQWIYDAEEDR
jgi:hypothetical protein